MPPDGMLPPPARPQNGSWQPGLCKKPVAKSQIEGGGALSLPPTPACQREGTALLSQQWSSPICPQSGPLFGKSWLQRARLRAGGTAFSTPLIPAKAGKWGGGKRGRVVQGGAEQIPGGALPCHIPVVTTHQVPNQISF